MNAYDIILLLPVMILGIWAQYRVSSTFKRYSEKASSRGYTGADVAREILSQNGIHDVYVEHISGNLNDHFDPRSKVIRLSDPVYASSSIAAIGVAAHEAGHAVQYATGYVPIKARNAFVPVASLGSKLSIPLVLLGFVLAVEPLVTFGITLYAAIAVFQLITLPVELNASSRALATLEDRGFLAGQEMDGARKVLNAAALTYVAALITSLAQLLRLILLYGNRRDRD